MDNLGFDLTSYSDLFTDVILIDIVLDKIRNPLNYMFLKGFVFICIYKKILSDNNRGILKKSK
ncbi:hypothetical protein GCM10007978_14390 [Shewanella hanedai]|nr:hypothetical protein GCM10007978_14390 [Shewanella hanedai]